MPNLNTFLSPPLIVKIIFVIVSLSFIGGIIYFLLKTEWLKRLVSKDIVEFLSFKPYEMRIVSKNWEKILKRLEKGMESEIKLAVIEADDLLNDVLERMGYTGNNLGERLKQLDEATLPNIHEVLDIRRIKGNIVHDPTYRLNLEQTRMILYVYKQALVYLNAI